MQLQKIYYDEFREEREENHIDDITWNDLEMDKIFSHINYTKSYIGEQVLYKRLREPEADRDWKAFEEKLSYLENNAQARANEGGGNQCDFGADRSYLHCCGDEITRNLCDDFHGIKG